jgi:hypothetical protein
MNTEKEKPPTEETDDGYLIEIYTDERIEEFLAENKLTPEQKNQIEEKLRQPHPPKQ